MDLRQNGSNDTAATVDLRLQNAQFRCSAELVGLNRFDRSIVARGKWSQPGQLQIVVGCGVCIQTSQYRQPILAIPSTLAEGSGSDLWRLLGASACLASRPPIRSSRHSAGLAQSTRTIPDVSAIAGTTRIVDGRMSVYWWTIADLGNRAERTIAPQAWPDSSSIAAVLAEFIGLVDKYLQ